MARTILVVDDILANVRLLEAKLTAEYFDVVTAMNGMDALELASSKQFGAILLDIMMPGIDGIEVCRRLKSNPETFHIPICMVTALSESEDKLRGLEAGANFFLTKPVNDISLFALLKAFSKRKVELDQELEFKTKDDKWEALLSAREDSVKEFEVLVLTNKDDLRTKLSLLPQTSGSRCTFVSTYETFHIALREHNVQVAIISNEPESFDPLRVLSQTLNLRTGTNRPEILMSTGPDWQPHLFKALDMGIDNVLSQADSADVVCATVQNHILLSHYKRRIRARREAGRNEFEDRSEVLDAASLLSQVASPKPFLNTSGKVDAGANLEFEKIKKVERLPQLILAQSSIVDLIVASLPPQAPKSLLQTLVFYRTELTQTVRVPILESLRCMAEMISADCKAKSADAEWASEGLRKGFDLFEDNHSKFLSHLENTEKDKLLTSLQFKEDAVSSSELIKSFSNLNDKLQDNSSQSAFTKDFVSIVDAMTRNAEAISYINFDPVKREPVIATRVPTKKRFLASAFGFFERTYNLIGTTATLHGYANSPQGSAIMRAMSNLIEVLAKCFP